MKMSMSVASLMIFMAILEKPIRKSLDDQKAHVNQRSGKRSKYIERPISVSNRSTADQAVEIRNHWHGPYLREL